MIRLDQDQQKPGEESDVWQWAKLTQIDPKPFSTSIDLPDLAARGGDVVLTLNFRGLSELMPPPKYKGTRPDDHVVAVDAQRQNGRDARAGTAAMKCAARSSSRPRR